MKKFFLHLILIFSLLEITSIQAQYTEIINSNRPGFSESPYSVGTGVYQFESNFFYKNTSIEPTFSQPQSFGVDLLFRTSFFLEKLELNTQLTYQRDKVAFKNIFSSHYFTTGLSRLSMGVKYLLFEPKYTDKTKEVKSWKRRFSFDKKRFIPSVAIYVGMNTNFVSEIYKTESSTPKVGVLLQHNLTNEFNVVSNVFYDKIGSNFSEISFTITATQNFSDLWSGFIEHQGIFQKYQNNLNFGTGLAYLFSKNFQINVSTRFLQEGKSQGFYGSLGISYRIDRHQDSYTDLDQTETKDSNKLSVFFNKILSLFKKKRK
ncbi:transporter [Polaribacter sp.]|nr:transporter [Polaribacter sp.]